MLDYLYGVERLRRWGGMSDWAGVASPLLEPQFQRAAFGLSPAQRQSNALHRALTARLVPAWADIGYYERPLDEVPSALQARLGSRENVTFIDSVIASPDSWADGHNVAVVQKAWRRLRVGATRPQGEALLQRVIWRATFEDYLAELNGEESPTRTFADHQTTAGGRRASARARRGLAKVANQLSRHRS
jgi:hypothetical protein